MNLIDLVQNREPLKELRAMTRPDVKTVLWGTGVAAGLNYDYLQRHEVSVDAVVVDKEFLRDCDGRGFRGHTVQIIEDFLDKCHTPINLVVGFYSTDLGQAVSQKLLCLGKRDPQLIPLLLDIHLLMWPERRFSYRFIEENLAEFQWVYDLWADQRSRDVMVAFLNQRISMQIGELEKVRDDNQYFPPSVIRLMADETFVDCGAYNGDTIRDFLQALRAQTGNETYRKIYALEPNTEAYPDLIEFCRGLPNVVCIDRGAWSSESTLRFEGGIQRSSRISEEGDAVVHVAKLDDMLAGDECSFIKMDIEGAEYDAIQGAQTTIRKCRPKLAICIYHRNNDLLTIPRYLHDLNSRYRFFLRAHESKSGEVVLYAV